jgi:predicted transcriptional regulator
MADRVDPDSLLELVRYRRAYLQFLAPEPRHKRDVIDALEDSRSTVDRAIERLHDAGVVTRTDDGAWVTTTQGDVLLAAVEELRETAEVVGAAEEVLPYFPCEERVPPALFRDAVVDVANGPRPLAIAERVRDAMANADAIRGFAMADHDVGVKDELIERSLGDPGVDVEFVFDAALADGVAANDDVPIAEMAAEPGNGFYVHETVPFGLYLVEQSTGPQVTIVGYDEQNIVRGQVTSTNPGAVHWAETVFERYREESRDVRTLLD